MGINLPFLGRHTRYAIAFMVTFSGIGLSGVASADNTEVTAVTNAERQPLINELADLMGLREMLAESVSDGESVIKQQMQPMLDKVFQDLGAGAASDALMVEFDRFVSAITGAWDVDEATQIYTEAIAEGMTDGDLRTSVAFYKTPAGQASVEAGKRANGQLTQYINSRTMTVMQSQMPVFIANIQRIASQRFADEAEAAD